MIFSNSKEDFRSKMRRESFEESHHVTPLTRLHMESLKVRLINLNCEWTVELLVLAFWAGDYLPHGIYVVFSRLTFWSEPHKLCHYLETSAQ